MNARLLAEVLASRTTRAISVRWGESFPFFYVSAYPRSGSTWLARMVAEVLRLPLPRHFVLPPRTSCVVQNHWRYDPRLRRVCYIYRDGRDVMTSLYYHRLRVVRGFGRGPGRTHVAPVYEKLLGRGYDAADVVRHLPRFIEFELTRPGRGAPLNWPDHTEDWVQPGRDDVIAYLTYEELCRDCAGALARAIETVSGRAADRALVDAAVEKMSMRQLTGREPGELDATSHVRKAVVGDWKDHFSREAAEVFDHLAGRALIRLGYERDSQWVDRYDYRTP